MRELRPEIFDQLERAMESLSREGIEQLRTWAGLPEVASTSPRLFAWLRAAIDAETRKQELRTYSFPGLSFEDCARAGVAPRLLTHLAVADALDPAARQVLFTLDSLAVAAAFVAAGAARGGARVAAGPSASGRAANG